MNVKYFTFMNAMGGIGVLACHLEEVGQRVQPAVTTDD